MIQIQGKMLCENCFEPMIGNFCTHCGYNPNVTVTDPTMLRPGSILLGKYIIGKVIGKGGFGITYLAYDNTAGKKVAIKEFFPYGVALRATGSATVNVSNEENAEAFKLGAEKFYNEAKLVAKFNGNPNIVGVYEFFYENDTVYFAMEYLKGRSLKEYIDKNGMLSAPKALFIMKNAANALMAAHSSNVLHRDISPDNIIICDNGDIKLIDFGAARQVVAEHSQSFSVILKPGFAPLEQYQKKGNQGPWTDIYALGATIYYTLTGDIPDDPMTRLDDDAKFQSNEFGINEEMWNIIQKATQLKIEDRYGDIFRLLNDINAVSFESEPLIAAEQAQETVPQFRTAAVFGTKQPQPISQTPPQSVQQPVGVGAPAQPAQPAQQSYGAPTQPVPQNYAPPAQPAPQKPVKSEADLAMERIKKKKRKNGIIAAAVGVVVVAAAIIIPNAVNNSRKSKYQQDADDLNSWANSATSQTVSQPSSGSNTQRVIDEKITITSGSSELEALYSGEWKNGKPNGWGTLFADDGGYYIAYIGDFKDGDYSGFGQFADSVYGSGSYILMAKDSLQYAFTHYDQSREVYYESNFIWVEGDDPKTYYYDYVNNKIYTVANGVISGDFSPSEEESIRKKIDDYFGYTTEYLQLVTLIKEHGGNANIIGSGGGNNNGDQFVSSGTTSSEQVTRRKYITPHVDTITYTGEWSNNAPNGKGKAVYSSGAIYDGEWKDGERSGQGTYTLFNGDGSKYCVYVGEWKDDKSNGQGTETWYEKDGKEKSRRTGIWKDDKFVG